MSTPHEIPTVPAAQKMTIPLGGTTYILRLMWCISAACWVLSISDVDDNLIVGGIFLVTGADLLEQYDYLGIGGVGNKLIVQSDNDPTLVPSYTTLGLTGHLYFVTPT
jgi:uncharacterized protein DUF6983